jgi:hypothetical protein
MLVAAVVAVVQSSADRRCKEAALPAFQLRAGSGRHI